MNDRPRWFLWRLMRYRPWLYLAQRPAAIALLILARRWCPG